VVEGDEAVVDEEEEEEEALADGAVSNPTRAPAPTTNIGSR
jgi:hypothetical protein